MKSAARALKERSPIDVERVRAEFPLLSREVGGRRIVYLDSAATTQKPRVVIDAIRDYYERHNSNVHRGVHRLSQEATEAFEGAREKMRRFLGADSTEEIIYVRGTTEAINLVAQSLGRARLRPGDEVLITAMEHHSNIVPWQMLCEATGAKLRVAPIDDRGALIMEEFAQRLSKRTGIVAAVHASNALGTLNPVRQIVELAHEKGAIVLIDGAQAAGHMPVDVSEIGCDFYACSGHKMFAPTGIGILWGRRELLEEMPPWQGGGDMIRSVTFEKTTYNELPHKFEAGTPDVAGAVGLGAALDWLTELGMDQVAAHEEELLDYGTELLSSIARLRLIGTAPEKSAVLSFVMEGVHPHDIGTILDHEGVAIRTGHHCAQPVMQRFDVPATARASLSVYSTREDLERLVEGLERVREVFA
jgi:cysteine desulfurase/selenocysteine lyase